MCFYLVLFAFLSDNVFVSNQPKCRPERKTAKLVSPDVSKLTGYQQANMLTAADLEFPASALDQSRLSVSLSFCFALPASLIHLLSLLQPDQVKAYLSVAPPPALLYLHRSRQRCLKCFNLPDDRNYWSANHWCNKHLNIKRVLGRSPSYWWQRPATLLSVQLWLCGGKLWHSRCFCLICFTCTALTPPRLTLTCVFDSCFLLNRKSLLGLTLFQILSKNNKNFKKIRSFRF